jgi:hypothetical protein
MTLLLEITAIPADAPPDAAIASPLMQDYRGTMIEKVRTTVALLPWNYREAKEYAEESGQTLSETLDELVRRGLNSLHPEEIILKDGHWVLTGGPKRTLEETLAWEAEDEEA